MEERKIQGLTEKEAKEYYLEGKSNIPVEAPSKTIK